MKEKKGFGFYFGCLLFTVQLLASAGVMLCLLSFPVLPAKYMAAVAAVLIVFLLASFFLLLKASGKKRYILGCLFSILLSAVLFYGCYLLFHAKKTVDNITTPSAPAETLQVEGMVVMVMNEDPATSMEDALSYEFGVQNSVDFADTLAVIEHINRLHICTLKLHAYDSYPELAEQLLNGTVQAIIMDKTFVDLIEEYEEGFAAATRILEEFQFSASLPRLTITPTFTPTPSPEPTRAPEATATPTPEPTPTPLPGVAEREPMPPRANNTDLTKNYFTVYCSGIDVAGSINTRSRSDVNILMVVNPTTKNILLVTIPRDAYVTIPGISGGAYDKLTHAGIYGVNKSKETLEQVYGIDIDYYIRVNFTSIKKFVDLVGGVSVYNKYAFESSHLPGEFYPKGYVTMDGAHALAFARERYNVPGGDAQRGKNQTEVVKAVLNKMMSPAMLTNFTNILSAVSENFQTNLSTDQLTSLVRMQLNDGASWNIESVAVVTQGGSNYCYSYKGRKLYVGYIDHDSLSTVSRQIRQVMAGN